jgi:hypothetical protein
MLQGFLAALRWVMPAAVGWLANDAATWSQRLPLIGPFFAKKDAQGNTSPIVLIVTALALAAIVIVVLKRVFKIKLI